MTDGDDVVVEVADLVATVTITRPGARNALTPDTRRRLTRALDSLGARDDVRSIVLTGAGEHFCVGADVGTIETDGKTHHSVRENLREVHALLRAIVDGSRPVVTAVEGDAFGAGLSMAAASDIVVATTRSRFGAAYSKLGLIPDLGLLQHLPQRVGLPRARRMMMLSEAVAGPDAHACGLADELVEPGEARAAAQEVAGRLARMAPLAVTLIKSALADGPLDAARGLRIEMDCMPMLVLGDDHKRAVEEFRSRRPRAAADPVR